MSEITLTDANFKTEVLDSKLPVLVDFWAPWCGPCQMISPIVASVAKEYDGRIKVGKLNVDENPVIASEYGIMSIPTIKIFKDGKIAEETVGVQPVTAIMEKVDKFLGK
jgi:thioredoxin 1